MFKNVNLCRLPDVLVPLVKAQSENIREETRCLASDFEDQVANILRGRSASYITTLWSLS